jgi:regulator of replication initiation timing
VGIIDNFKDVLKLADTLNNLGLYKKLTELQTRVMEIEEENRTLKEQLGQLNQHLSTQQSLQHDGELLWKQKDGEREGPYCQVCWDVDKKLVRMRGYYPHGQLDCVCDYCYRHRIR